MQSNKTLEINGKIIKRIFNPMQLNKSGKEYSVAYLVIEWTTGPNGEYTDLIAIKTFQPKYFKDVRAGYRVVLQARYSCTKFGDLRLRTFEKDGVKTTHPQLFPDLLLDTRTGVAITDESVNLESHDDVNQDFEKQVIDPEEDDDLPF